MIKVTLEIDNKTAHSCSPIEFLKRYILKDTQAVPSKNKIILLNPYALIEVTEIEQI
jgi:hypothetical protein